MFNKKILKITALVISLTLIMLTGCSNTNKNNGSDETGDVTKVAFVSDQPLDASEWLVNLVQGINEYQKSNDNVEVKLVEATQASEYEPKIRALAQQGYDVIITTYASTAEATIAVANDYPNIKFGSLDGTIDNLEGYSNIEEFGLNRTETAYLAGVVAASMSETGVVGIVGGMDEPVINSIIAGWQQGLISVNEDIVDYVSYAGTWTDPTTGKDLGLALADKGADVIAAAAGGTGAGTAQAAAETSTYFVAWDTHYDEVFKNNKVELGSALNYFDVMVIQFIEDAISGNFKGGQRIEYGMDKGVCAFDIYEDAPVSDEARQNVEEALEKIKNGEITISTELLHK
ncbi:MAG: BMP family ABC transporter substrate-binding protein [Tissierellales bacterium]